MRYHPDRNDDPRAEEAFILVNEAYEYLSDAVRRKALRNTDHDWTRITPEWETERERARQRARAHAHAKAEEFQRSPIYKAAMALNKVYDYVFIALGLGMAFMPIIGHLTESEVEREEKNVFQFIFPFLIGGAFIYGIWYFLFKQQDD